MRKHSKYLVIVMAILISVMTLLPACSGGGDGSDSVESIQQNVTVGKRVFVDKSGVVFFGYENFICTALLKDGAISEFVPEGATTGRIYAMAVYNDELYISASDGLFKYPLSMFNGGGSKESATVILKEALYDFNHFEIFEDKLFFMSGYTLFYVPVSGGEKTEVADDITDFEVSDKGIYAAKRDGEIKIISPDLNEDRDAGEIAAEVRFTVGGTGLYYRSGDGIGVYSVQKEGSEEIPAEQAVYEHCVPWSNGENVLYENGDFEIFLVTPKGEQDLGKNFHFPEKAHGCMSGDYLLTTSPDYTDMTLFDLGKGAVTDYDLDKEMKDYLSKLKGGDSDPEPQPAPPSGSDDYDLRKGMAMEASSDAQQVYFFFNDFMVIMPNEKYLGHLEEKDSVTFFHTGASTDGYGGKLVTIKAYDLDDDSYKNLQSYHVAGVGKNCGKRFIAIYPTDLQCDPNNADQMAEYKVLHEYVLRINEGSGDSPLQTADSD